MALNIVAQIDDEVRVERVLVSVSEKTGLETFASALTRINSQVTLYSTGGTYQALKEGLGEALSARHLVSVSDYTGQPEMQGGLVKTLDFKIYLGLLSETYNPAHVKDLGRVNGVKFDLVVVNLYPFARVSAAAGATIEQARTHIDIGGPCMVRAAAKNFLRVAVLTDPADYGRLLAEMQGGGGRVSLRTRFELARKAFAHTAAYDAAIAQYLAAQTPDTMERCYRIMNRA